MKALIISASRFEDSELQIPRDRLHDVLILPGGKAPEAIRKEQNALKIVRQFFNSNKPVATICHGPQIVISAGLMRSRHATGYQTVAKRVG